MMRGMRVTARAKSSRGSFAIGLASFLALAFGVSGAMALYDSTKDYSAFTESTVAWVTEVVDERHTHSTRAGFQTDTVRDYYVDYEADGERFSHEKLSGMVDGLLQEGDVVPIRYPPGQGADAVTELSTTAATAHRLRWAGLFCLAVSAAALTGRGVLVRRRRRRLAATA